MRRQYRGEGYNPHTEVCGAASTVGTCGKSFPALELLFSSRDAEAGVGGVICRPRSDGSALYVPLLFLNLCLLCLRLRRSKPWTPT